MRAKRSRDFFIVANSFAAPFFSDTDKVFVKSTSAKAALAQFKKSYDHPAGLFAAGVWESADAFHKNEKPLVTWLSEKAKRQK